MKPDGSRTVYKFDGAQHKAVATTTDQDGKLREKIHYDGSGRLEQETQSAENGTLLHKIVYSYDPAGKQTGYSIFDANGKLVGRTITGSPTPKRKK